ncbi:MAG: formylglycine-generating enzyme family protein, partial [Planctomycetota bacterium]
MACARNPSQPQPPSQPSVVAKPAIDGSAMRRLPAGHFERGTSEANGQCFRGDHVRYDSGGDDRPAHAVILTTGFDLAETEVTVGQFEKFVAATGYVTAAEKSGKGIVGWDPTNRDEGVDVVDRIQTSLHQKPSFTWREPGFPQSSDHPVVGVCYHDAVAYCRWLSDRSGDRYRLPTEAEWEYACGSGSVVIRGDQTPFCFGDDYRGRLHQFANFADPALEHQAPGRALSQWFFDVENTPSDGFAFTAPVGSKQANPWGLRDMHGNVWEWCADEYLDTTYDAFGRPRHRAPRTRAVDPRCREKWIQGATVQVIRGGSWFVAPVLCRTAARGYFAADDASAYVGFRVVRELPKDLQQKDRERHQRSESAREALAKIASSHREDHDGVLTMEFVCENLEENSLEPLADLQYRIHVDLRPPGAIKKWMLK